MDDQKLDFSQRFFYQGMMFSGVPNLIQTFGYINASWTLRADLNSEFVCALLKRMDETGTTQCVPLLRDFELEMGGQDWVSGFNPGYFKRGNHLFPKQGSHSPWHNTQDYLLDLKLLAEGPPDDGVLQFQKTAGPKRRKLLRDRIPAIRLCFRSCRLWSGWAAFPRGCSDTRAP